MPDHDDDHHHHHDHSDRSHDVPSDVALRARALETLLVEKGYVRRDTLDRIVDLYENEVGPHYGAKVVAKAWSDPDYKARLLADATGAIAELGFTGLQGEDMVVVENTEGVHNLVVCTLCSCYPWAVLGLPPAWYKSPAYRSRAVREPRALLGEVGVELGADTEIRVWDSTAEVRYLVLPRRPPGTDGASEEELALRVTRNSMIGTAVL